MPHTRWPQVQHILTTFSQRIKHWSQSIHQFWQTLQPRQRILFRVGAVALLLFTTLFSVTIGLHIIHTPGSSDYQGSPNTASGINLNPSHPTKDVPMPTLPGTGSTAKPGQPGPDSNYVPAMKPLHIPITPGQSMHGTSNDGVLDVTIPADAFTGSNVAPAPGAGQGHSAGLALVAPTATQVVVTQIAPASGSSSSGGVISLGTYLLQLQDAQGKEVLSPLGLQKPVTLGYHWAGHHPAVSPDHLVATVNMGALPNPLRSGGTHLGQPQKFPVSFDTNSQTLTAQIPLGGPTANAASSGGKGADPATSLDSSGSSSSAVSWLTNAPQAYFGKAESFHANLQSGGLSSEVPIDIPSGPGGLTPPLHLAYSSSSINENHGVQAANGWVGAGWNMDLGQITWSEINEGACSGCVTNYRSAWSLSDPYGTSADLIPPSTSIATYYDDTPYQPVNAPTTWHTTPEAHVKVISYTNPTVDTTYFPPWNGSTGYSSQPPCFRVWLQNGVMEEFGCTLDSRQFYPGWTSHTTNYVSAWKLDLVTDPNGNQIHITYTDDIETDPQGGNRYPRDVVPATVEWDSPACHDAQNACTGSNWQPRMRVRFAATHQVAHANGTTCGAAMPDNTRCDDAPAVGAMAAPTVESTYVLNDVFVEVTPTGNQSAWSALRSYQLRYSQSTWSVQPYEQISGLPIGQAGELLLTQVQEYGTDGTTSYPPETFTYGSQTENYVNQFMTANGPQTQVVLTRYLKGVDHWETTSSAPGGYQTEEILGAMYVNQQSGTIPLYNCLYGGWDHFNSLSSNCENQQVLGLMGFVFSRDKPAPANISTTPLYRCTTSSGEHFESPFSNCEGFNSEGLQGYALALPAQVPLKRYWTDATADHWETTGKVSSDYLVHDEGALGFLSPTSQSGMVQMTQCLGSNGKDYMLSISTAECSTGNSSLQLVRIEGYAYDRNLPQPTNPQTVLLYRCGQQINGGIYDHFSSLNSNCDGKNKDGPLAYIMTDWGGRCGPLWNNSCYLWDQVTHSYLISADNGEGEHQDFTWAEAHNNSHNVPQGQNALDPTVCNTIRTTAPCQLADEGAWSQIVLASRTVKTKSATNQDVVSSYTYKYSLTKLTSVMCSDCTVGMYWGNVNDGDYLDFYNTKFKGFNVATEQQPDNSWVTHSYYTTEGIGVYDANAINSQNLCYNGYSSSRNNCPASPSWDLMNAASGREYQTDTYDPNGKLLARTTTSYNVLSPPANVSPSPSVATYGNWDGHLVSEIGISNPEAVNDVQVANTTTYSVNGATTTPTNTTVPTQVSTYTYDAYGRVTKQEDTSNGGTPGDIVKNTVYVWNDAISTSGSVPTGRYIVDTVAGTDTMNPDGSGRTACKAIAYDGQSWATGQQSGLTAGLATKDISFDPCGSSSASAWGSGTPNITTTSYDSSGNALGTTDADANAGIAGHTGNGTNGACSNFSTCTTYDSSYGILATATGNAFYQTGNNTYDQSAAGGYGTWVTGETNENHQTTTTTYDPLGRTLTLTHPGETTSWTRQMAYTVWCSTTGSALACLEEDTTQHIDANTTVMTRVFYDGEGRPVESRTPGSNGQDVIRYALYDYMGNRLFTSEPYFVPAYTGAAGASAFIAPDTSKVGTSTTYDSLARVVKSIDPDAATTTTSYTVQCAIAGTSDTGCYTTTTVIDAKQHQSISDTDAMGRARFEQRFTGTGPYTLYATGSYTYDLMGNQLTVTRPNGTTTTYTYNALERRTQVQDPDIGTMTYTFDPDGSPVQQADGRGATGTVYVGYDGLGRQIWRSTHSDGSSPFATYTYDSTANNNNGVGELTSETFASGPSQSITGGYTYQYDLRGRKTAYTLALGSQSYTMQTGFNDADQATTVTYPDGDVVNTLYNSQDWLSGATESLNGTTTTLMGGMVYSDAAGANGQPTQFTEGNGLYTVGLGYDLTHRLNNVQATLSSNGSTLYSQQRQFDAVGNTIGQQTNIAGQTDNEAFCYDDMNRLTWAGSTGTPSCGQSLTPGNLTQAQYQQSYSYDTLWRMTQGPNGSTYQYGDANHQDAVTQAGGYTAAYDAAGDMTCRALTSSTTCSGASPTGQVLTWDVERNLIGWQSQASGAQQYLWNAYTGNGDRIWQQVTNNSTTTTTIYLGQAEEIATTGSTTTVTKYYYAGDRRVAERVGNAAITYLVADGLSSVTQALDSAGNVVATQLFGPYGNTRYQQGTMPTTFGFTGQRQDTSGLDLFGARFYDPAIGQFVSADETIPGSGAILGALNRFAYVLGNPETATDPSGHWGFGSIIKAVTNVVKAAAPAIAHAVQVAAPVVAAVADSALGISSIVNDAKTIFDPHASWSSRLLSVADLAINVAMDVDTVTGTGQAARAAYMGAKAGVKLAGKQAVKLMKGEAKHLAEKEIENVGKKRGEGMVEKVIKCSLNSFAGDTQVATPEGSQPIATLKVGDKVLAVDGATGKVQAEPVQHVMINHDNNLLDVTLAADTTAKPSQTADTPSKEQEAATAAHGSQAPPTETVHTTTEHPFLTAELGWVNAQDLKPGEHVRRLDGSLGVVVAVTATPGQAVRYNLTVAQDHTFVVGQGQWVVHNCGLGGKLDPTKQLTDKGGNLLNFFRGQQREELKKQGFKMLQNASKVARNHSEQFKQFIQDTYGVYNDDEWEYRMEEWVGHGKKPISNHYWAGRTGTQYEDIFFHHH
jgi:RHS repeat-associated protein